MARIVESEFETVEMMLNMGPQHPSTHGVFRMLLAIDGEKVVDCEPVIGYLHRGIEKLFENYGYRQIIPLFDRMDYISAFNCEHTLVMAIEKLMKIEVPERAEYVRVILCELNRIASHMLFYGCMGADAGALTPFLYGFIERERIQQIFEAVCGGRLTVNYLRVGGLKQDVPADFKERVRSILPPLERGLADCDNLLSQNEILLVRARDIGIIKAEEAINFGLSGPTLRASGVAEDIRRTEPYSIYDRFDFEIPVGEVGDTYDRYILRVEEMRQSIGIIKQALDQMPDGPILGTVPRVLRPPAGEVYVRTECPRGDFGVYLVSKGGPMPYRLKVRAPSFCNLMALRTMLAGCWVADTVMVLGSLDIVLGEVDR
ncbi:MAG: NADH-quinone oxidoreductase subunit D [Dehalococcoidia bacterium]|nr:NADH-quinone oxidoreductase subunit D [Dehalococcoidia bacterium]